MKWYEKRYRRHLCDMHIEDWDNEFLSKFSEIDYFNNLKRANINSAMIYFQSHVGLCYFPTKSGYMHKSFIGDEGKIKRLVDLCRENDIAVTGYYSVIFNNCAHDEHPDWRIIDKDGKSKREKGVGGSTEGMAFTDAGIARYGLCCPNNMEYRGFVKEQIEEMLEYFEVDGMFYDMLYWQQMCYCKSCRKRFERETGLNFPENADLKNDVFRILIRKRAEWIGEFAQWVTDTTKAIKSDISVEHNVAATVGEDWSLACTDLVVNASDYAGGDLYGGPFNHSFCCKFYRNLTKNQPFEYMFSSSTPNLSKHTIIKSEDIMKTALAVTMAHHGATMVIDAMNLDGTMNPRLYERIGNIFDNAIKYEKHFNGEMTEDIGIYYTFRCKYNPDGEKFLNANGALNSVKNMIESNIPVGVCGEYCDILKYKAIVFSLPGKEDEIDDERIAKYVKAGGILYFSGGYSQKMLKRYFDAEVAGRTEEIANYISPEKEGIFEYFDKKYPLPFDGTVPVLENAKGVVYAKITLPATKPDTVKFASIHSNPPYIKTDIPGVLATDYGKGKVIWSALPIEIMEGYEYKQILKNLIFEFLPKEELSFKSDAPKCVEITEFEDENSVYINTVHLNDEYFQDIVKPFDVEVKIEKPKKITRISDKADIEFKYENGYVTFTVSGLKIFELYEITRERLV